MTIITYGESKSVEGRKHANNPWSNVRCSIKGSSRSISSGGRRDSNVLGVAPSIDRCRGIDPRQLEDGQIIFRKRKSAPRSMEECDMWRPEVIKKTTKMSSKRVRTAARGQSDTQGASLQKQDRG